MKIEAFLFLLFSLNFVSDIQPYCHLLQVIFTADSTPLT